MFTANYKVYPECWTCLEEVEIDDCNDTCVETAAYFSRLDMAFISLFQFSTMDYSDSSRMYQKHGASGAPPVLIVIFVVVTGYILFNLIVAVVLCDALSELQLRKMTYKKEN